MKLNGTYLAHMSYTVSPQNTIPHCSTNTLHNLAFTCSTHDRVAYTIWSAYRMYLFYT